MLFNMGFQHNTEIASKAGKLSKRGPAKETLHLRELVHELVYINFEKIVFDLEYLEPEKRVDVWIKLLDFCLPKYERVDSLDNTDDSDNSKQ